MHEADEELYADGDVEVEDALYIQDGTRAAIDELRELLSTVSPLPHEGLEWTADAVIRIAVMEMYRRVEEDAAEKSMLSN